MKPILLIVLVVASVMSGAVVGSVSLSAPQRHSVSGAAVSSYVAAPAESPASDEPQVSTTSGQVITTGNSSPASQVKSNISQQSVPAQVELAHVSDSIVSAASAGVLCPDGSTRPACLTMSTPQPLPKPCVRGNVCDRAPISGRPGLPVCPHDSSTQGVCSPMTD